jgi:mevalonate kinase
MPRVGHGRAGGKVILLGEHAVVYGRPAVATGLGLGVVAEASEGDGPRLDSAEIDDPARATAVVSQAARLVGLDPARVVVTVRADLPPGQGLGSSAALSVATLRAVAALANRSLTLDEECARGRELEAIFHGTPSGIDPAAAALGRCLRFVRGEPPSITPLSPGGAIDLVVVYGAGRRSTGAVVGGLRERWVEDRARHERLFDQIGDIVATGITAIERGDARGLGAAFDANQAVLRALGVSSDAVDRQVAVARAAGAYGAKLTGGGAGGAIIAVADDADVLAARLGRDGRTVLRVALRPDTVAGYAAG